MTFDLDRAAGALVGLAAGDALGAPYEFTVPGPGAQITFRAGDVWELGEWTDDTAQALGIAQVAATGHLDELAVGQRFLDWYAPGVKDVGISTGSVLSGAEGDPAGLASSARRHFAANPRGAAGNGSLMRTSPVALAHLGDDEAIVHWARRISLLTHGDPLAAEGCILWCIAVDRAVREGRLDGVRDGLSFLPGDRAAFWSARIDEAETRDPHRFSGGNGFVVTALQAAHAVISQTPVPLDQPCRHLQDALVEAVRIGNDTDTVAAIAGQVLGARWGASAVPWAWRRHLHGWPGFDEADLARLAVLTANGGSNDSIGWPDALSLVDWGRGQEREPLCVELDPGEARPEGGPVAGRVLMGNLAGLPLALEQGADAVVSLCRVGAAEVPSGVDHARFWLVDRAGANANLDFVLAEAGAAVTALTGEGRDVFVHCVGGRSRTPTVVAHHLAARDDLPLRAAFEQVAARLPEVRPNGDFARLVSR